LPFDFLRFLLPEPLLLFEHSLFLFYDALLLLALLTLQTFGLFTLGLLNKFSFELFLRLVPQRLHPSFMKCKKLCLLRISEGCPLLRCCVISDTLITIAFLLNTDFL